MGEGEDEQKGTLAPSLLLKCCKMFLCISSYSNHPYHPYFFLKTDDLLFGCHPSPWRVSPGAVPLVTPLSRQIIFQLFSQPVVGFLGLRLKTSTRAPSLDPAGGLSSPDINFPPLRKKTAGAYAYRLARKKIAPFLYALTSSNINRFSRLFHFQNQEKICNNTFTKDPATPQVCRYTTL